MEPLQWLFVVTALTLVFVVFAINPLQAAIDEAIKNNAQLQSQRLVSVINLVAGAPDGTRYTLEMPRMKCTVDITDRFVKMTITLVTGVDIYYTASLIDTPVDIVARPLDCKSGNIVMMKTASRLEIFQS